MNSDRRFIFRGNASGVAAHMRRPVDQVLPIHGCSSLPVIGGLSESRTGPHWLGRFLSFESAATSARGDFTNPGAALAMTRGELGWDGDATTTRVSAQVRGFRAGGRFFADVVDVGLVSHSPQGTSQPSIRLAENRLEGIQVDNSTLKITLQEELFNRCDSLKKLEDEWAAGMPPSHAALFCAPAVAAGRALPSSSGVVLCTIVERMDWEGVPHPDAKIEGNVLRIPNFGSVYFGEMLITGESRRLTMVRFRFGSPDGGECTIGEGETNGAYWP